FLRSIEKKRSGRENAGRSVQAALHERAYEVAANEAWCAVGGHELVVGVVGNSVERVLAAIGEVDRKYLPLVFPIEHAAVVVGLEFLRAGRMRFRMDALQELVRRDDPLAHRFGLDPL